MINDWNKYKNACLNYARHYNRPDDADDFAGWACLKVFEGRKASIKNLFIDYLRNEYGSTGLLRHTDNPRKIKKNMCKQSIDDTAVNLNLRAASRTERNFGDSEYLLKNLSRYERTVLILREIWGFDEKEIAYCFGITESGICLQLKKIQSRLQKVVLKEQPGIPKEAKSEEQGIFEKAWPNLQFGKNQEMARKESTGLERYYETGFSKWLI